MQEKRLNQLAQDLCSADEARQLSALAEAGALPYGRVSLLERVEYLSVYGASERVRRAAAQTLQTPIFRHLRARRAAGFPEGWRVRLGQEAERWQAEGLIDEQQARVLRLRYLEPVAAPSEAVSAPPSGPRAEAASVSASDPPSWRAFFLGERTLTLALYLGAFFIAVALSVLAALNASLRRPVSLGATLIFAVLTPGMGRRSQQLGAVFFWLASLSLMVTVHVFVPPRMDFPWMAFWAALAVLWTWGANRYHSRLLALFALLAGWMATAQGTHRAWKRTLWLALLAGGTEYAYHGQANEALRRLGRSAAILLGAGLWVYFVWAAEAAEAVLGLLAVGFSLRWMFRVLPLPRWQRWAGNGLAALSFFSGQFAAYTWLESEPELGFLALIVWAGTLLLWSWLRREQLWGKLLWLAAGIGLFLAWLGGFREGFLWLSALAALTAALGNGLLARSSQRTLFRLAAVFGAVIAWATLLMRLPESVPAGWVLAGAVLLLPGQVLRASAARRWELRLAGVGVFSLGLLTLPMAAAAGWAGIAFALAGLTLAFSAWRTDRVYALSLLALFGGGWFWAGGTQSLLAWQLACGSAAVWLYGLGRETQRRYVAWLGWAALGLGALTVFPLPQRAQVFFLAWASLLPGLAWRREGKIASLWSWQALWTLAAAAALQEAAAWRWGAYPWVWLGAGALLRGRQPSRQTGWRLWLDEASFAVVSLAALPALWPESAGGTRWLVWILLAAASLTRAFWPCRRAWMVPATAFWLGLLLRETLLWLNADAGFWPWAFLALALTVYAVSWLPWTAAWKGWRLALALSAGALAGAALSYGHAEGGLAPVAPLTALAGLTTAEAVRRRNVWLGYPAALFYLLTYFRLLNWMGRQEIQIYTAGVGGAGLVMHYLLRRRGFRRAAWLTGVVSQLVLLGTAWVQMVQHDQLRDFVFLLVEALLALGYGLAARSRSLTYTPLAFLLLGGVTVLYGWLRGMNVVILLGGLGLVLLLLGVYGVQQRGKWQHFTARFDDWTD